MEEIQPIEDLVFEGLLRRFCQTFACRAIITTSIDRSKALDRLFGGKTIEYPFAFLTIQNVAANPESYATNRLARRGVPVVVNSNQIKTTRMIPTNYEIEVEFVTNKFQGIEPTTVLSYARRWLFARRCGYLKFNIKYGQVEVRCGVTMAESVATPLLESKVDTAEGSAYKIVTSLTVHGWSSEPALGSQGIVNELEVDAVVVGADGSVPGYQFFPF